MFSSLKIDAAATLVVGDIHGCFDELIALIELAGLREHDHLIAVGDLVDRGPKSREVVEFFASHPERRHSVRGNHENKHLVSRGRNIPSNAGRILRKQTSQCQYDAMIAYFEKMPLAIETPDALIVHAGLQAGVSLSDQDPKILMGVGSSGRDGFDGKSPWWFDRHDLIQTKPIVFGHEKHEEGVVRGMRNNVYGIDTGAALGGPLTGLLLPEFRLLSVPAPDYWTQQLKEWLPVLQAENIYNLHWDELLAIDTADSACQPEVQEVIAAATQAYWWLINVIEQRRAALIVETSYLELEGAQRGNLNRSWRNSIHTDLDRWVIESLPNRDIAALIRQKLPDWGSLQRSLFSLQAASLQPLPV